MAALFLLAPFVALAGGDGISPFLIVSLVNFLICLGYVFILVGVVKYLLAFEPARRLD